MLRSRTSLFLLLLTGSALSLSSCRITGRQVDATWLTDALTPPENDTVQVETGRSGATPTPHRVTSAPSAVSARAGQKSAPVPPRSQSNSCVVRPGDTLFAIARRQGVSPSALMAENHLTAKSKLHPGQVLRIPHRKASSPAAVGRSAASTYTVRPGDTLSGIAARCRVSVPSLLKANGMTPAQASQIRIGQKLRIPPSLR